jgi:hypothetical protein
VIASLFDILMTSPTEQYFNGKYLIHALFITLIMDFSGTMKSFPELVYNEYYIFKSFLAYLVGRGCLNSDARKFTLIIVLQRKYESTDGRRIAVFLGLMTYSESKVFRYQ